MALKAHIEQGYFLDFDISKGDSFTLLHQFCGENDFPNAICPNCDKPLLLFLSLDKRDVRLNLSSLPSQILPLCWCWTCNVAQESMCYQIDSNGDFRWLKYGKGGVEEDFPYSNYPKFFPSVPVSLTPLSEEEQRIIQGINCDEVEKWDLPEDLRYLSIPNHQVGGEPYLIQQDPDYHLGIHGDLVTCPICSQTMNFLAAIGDKSLGDIGFVDNEFVQVLFHYCFRDHVISAFQQCD